jgi:hypothetical protein
MMPRWQRIYVIATCAVIAGAFALSACDWGQWPKLSYLPLSGAVTLHPPVGALAITYIGSLAWLVGGAAVGAIAGAMLCAAAKKPWQDRALRLFGAWSITAILLAGAFETWNLWPW